LQRNMTLHMINPILLVSAFVLSEVLLIRRFRSERRQYSNKSPLSSAASDTIKLCIWIKPSITPIRALISTKIKVIAPKGGCHRFNIKKIGYINIIVLSRMKANPRTSASLTILCANKGLE